MKGLSHPICRFISENNKMKEFLAYNSFWTKLTIKLKDGEIKVETKGLLSPFLKKLEKKLENQIKDNSYEIIDKKLYISSSFPPIPSLAFKRLIRNEMKRVLGIHYPNSFTIMVTGQCGCDCEHCLANKMMGDKNLSKNDIEGLIEEALSLGASQIVFEGGEPTLRDDLPELVGLVDERATTMVVTNGANLDSNYINSLDKNNLDYLMFSLDSPYSEKHNQFRNRQNLFQKVLKGIRLSSDSNILSGILYIAHPKNSSRKHLEKLIELGDSLDVFEVMVDEIVDSGGWRGNEVLDERDKKRIKEFNRELVDERNIKIMNNFFLMREPENFGCFAGKRWLYATPEGEIMPCMHTPVSFGNIHDNSLKSIWKEIRSNRLYKDSSKCVYEKEKYKNQILPKILEKEELPYKIKE